MQSTTVTSTAETVREQIARAMPDALAAPAPDHAETLAGALAGMLATSDPLVRAERLPEVAGYLRDTLGYELLSNITAVDYLAAGLFEIVYHFVRPQGGEPVAIKVRVARDVARLPSLTGEWPGADLQEREAFDLFGLEFEGHPHLRRIYMWDELEGFPMRKDFPKQGDKYLEEQ